MDCIFDRCNAQLIAYIHHLNGPGYKYECYSAIERIEAITCSCGAVKPDGQSCSCFDNGSE